MHMKNNEFMTADFGLACFLQYSDVRLKELKNDPDVQYKIKKIFCFERSPEIETLLFQWRRGEAIVNLQKFLGVQISLRAILHDSIGDSINRSHLKSVVDFNS